MVRIGHMGWVFAAELESVITGLDDVAEHLGIARATRSEELVV
jgi:aspartate aminotransferase-like enzyme